MPRRRKKGRARRDTPPAPPRASSRATAVCALAVAVASLLVYLRTIIPTAVDQDSGELVAAAHVLGIAHPTGYPLWTMLGRGFDLLPLGHTSAFRVALLSAVSAAAAAGLVCWLTAWVTGRALPGVVSGLAFAFWFPTWSQAVRAEVYALTGLLFALFLLALWRWDQRRSPRQLYWGALAAGFAAMHHRTAFLAAAPALAVALWLTRPRRAKVWVGSALAFAAPFLCYLYLPIRAAARPPVNWGNPDTLGRFLGHMLGRQYSRWAFLNSLDEALAQAVKLTGEALAGPGWPSLMLALIAAPLVAWGLAHLIRQHTALGVSLPVGGLLLSVWVLEWGETGDLKVFLVPLGLMLVFFGGVGLARLRSLLPAHAGYSLAPALLGAAACVLLFWANWPRSDQSNVWRHRDRWAAGLSQMTEDAIFVADWDDAIFITQYLQQVEGRRKDVTILTPQWIWTAWYRDLLPDSELRQAAWDCWRQIDSELDVRQPASPGFWQGTALLAHRLAQHYRGRRTVYALHGPWEQMLPGPPYFLGVNENLYELAFERPVSVANQPSSRPIAEFPGGVNLISFEFAEAEARAGELLEFVARWQLESPLPGALFAVRLVPIEASHGSAEAAMAGWEELGDKALIAQGFPVLYGSWGLRPSPPDTVYEQRGRIIVPTNLPSGRYSVAIGHAQSYPPEYEGWKQLGAEAALMVRAAPPPENAP